MLRCVVERFWALGPWWREGTRNGLDELLKRMDIPVVMITHDPDDLQWFGEVVLHLRDGAIVEPEASSTLHPKIPT